MQTMFYVGIHKENWLFYRFMSAVLDGFAYFFSSSYWSSPVCVVYKSQAPGICPEKDLDRNGVWVRVLILFSSMLLQAMAVLMQWQGSLKLWLYETKANFLSFVHYRERLPAGRKACCANYSIHESSLKYVMDFTGLFTGKQGNTLVSTCCFIAIIRVKCF